MSRENTAVNRLIEMAHGRSLEADDALFSEPRPSPKKVLPPPFRARVPASTQTALKAAPQPANPYVDEPVAPPPIKRMPVEAEAVDIPVDVEDPTPLPAPLPHLMHDMTGSWFERGLELEAEERSARIERRRSSGRMRTALWLTAAFAAGLVATAIVAWPGKSLVDSSTPAPAPAAAIAKAAPAPAVAPAEHGSPAAPQVVVVTPPPIVVVAPAAPVVEEPAPAPAPAPAVVEEPAPVRKAAPAAKAAKPAPRVEKRVARVDAIAPPKATATGGGSGVLALGAKPPCDIFIDGKNTGLTTPQRALKVPAGAHRITLVNREHKITESFSVNVKAGDTTKVVKDLTRRMK
jgi:hypothetical protein